MVGELGKASSAGVVVSVNWTRAAITELLTLFGRSCGCCGGGFGALLVVLPTLKMMRSMSVLRRLAW